MFPTSLWNVSDYFFFNLNPTIFNFRLTKRPYSSWPGLRHHNFHPSSSLISGTVIVSYLLDCFDLFFDCLEGCDWMAIWNVPTSVDNVGVVFINVSNGSDIWGSLILTNTLKLKHFPKVPLVCNVSFFLWASLFLTFQRYDSKGKI